jgi:hypothetical protein
LHDVAAVSDPGITFADVVRLFRSEGCSALGDRCRTDIGDVDRARAAGAALLFDLLGDDVDGIAATLEDFAAFGVL